MTGEFYSFTDTDFASYIKVVEDEFGSDWLRKKANKALRLGRWKSLNPVIRGWSRAKLIWEARTLSRSDMDEDVARLGVLASDLGLVRTLPNYEVAVLPRLKGVDYDKVQYEVHIAAEAVRSGYMVELVPVSSKKDERTPDIKASSHKCDFYLECKRKDAYCPQGVAGNELWEELHSRIFALSDELLRNRQVTILSLGNLEQRDIDPITQGLQHLLSGGTIGFYSHPVTGIGLAIQELVIPRMNMLPIPDDINPSVIQATNRIDENGNPYFADPKRVALYRIDSHRLSSILQSFNNARGQIAKGSVGIVCIDLDITHVNSLDIDVYLQLLGNAVARLFTPTDNTRIGAVLLTAGPYLFPLQNRGHNIGQLMFHKYGVRNPYGALSSDCPLPGEQ